MRGLPLYSPVIHLLGFCGMPVLQSQYSNSLQYAEESWGFRALLIPFAERRNIIMRKLRTKSPLLFIAVACIVIALVYFFFDSNYLFNLLCQIMCYYIAVVGLNFITGMTGQPMLGMAGVFALGGYTSGLLTTKLGFTPWTAIPFVLLAGLIIGILLGYPSLRVSGVYLSFTTIGFSEIVRILLNNMTGLTGGGTGLKDIPSFSVFGYTLTSMRELFLLYALIAMLVALFASRIIHSKLSLIHISEPTRRS